MTGDPTHSVFGIRHHGPGSARGLVAALREYAPDIVLIEGPPDAAEVLPLAGHEAMRPPVALLVYRPDEPRQSVFYPFTHYSPEWQAIGYALTHDVPARFIDLPVALRFALDAEEAAEGAESEEPPAQLATDEIRESPFVVLARAAGYSDPDLWWERVIEQRRDATDVFAAIAEAMNALREEAPEPDLSEKMREAHMRQMIRTAKREGFERIAVVCGAWHVPALAEIGPVKPDADLLKGLKKVKVEATWIPWTNSRLSYRSGYGAGVRSPGWHAHLWAATSDDYAPGWIARAARCLRDEGLDAPSSNVIEAVRLAEALAAMRDLATPGLDELNEAIVTALCNGNLTPMQLIRDKLEIGEELGEVPDDRASRPAPGRPRRPPEAPAPEAILRAAAARPRPAQRERPRAQPPAASTGGARYPVGGDASVPAARVLSARRGRYSGSRNSRSPSSTPPAGATRSSLPLSGGCARTRTRPTDFQC